eukprot:Platyproteum_vivax@DN3319_c0_g1_i1.p1
MELCQMCVYMYAYMYVFVGYRFGVSRCTNVFRTATRSLVYDLTSVDEYDKLLHSEKPVLMQYTASWCGPCNTIKPHMVHLSDWYPEVKFVKVDIEQYAELCDVASVPTFRLYKNNEVLGELGAVPAKLEDLLAAHSDKLK